ncbi:MAG: T9SS type A sorting domain-containing protein, partial [Bacteroidota bacterium]
FQIIAPGTVLNEGESATIQISVGTEETPVAQGMGFEIELEIGEDANFPTAPNLGFGNSWFFGAGTPYTSLALDEGNRTLTLVGNQSSGQSGFGTLFEITLEAQVNGVKAADLVADGGGWIIVDNIGFRTMATENFATNTAPDPVLYPNPCTDHVNFTWNGVPPRRVSLYDALGNRVGNMSPNQMSARQYPTEQLATGLYHVVLEYANYPLITKELIVN